MQQRVPLVEPFLHLRNFRSDCEVGSANAFHFPRLLARPTIERLTMSGMPQFEPLLRREARYGWSQIVLSWRDPGKPEEEQKEGAPRLHEVRLCVAITRSVTSVKLSRLAGGKPNFSDFLPLRALEVRKGWLLRQPKPRSSDHTSKIK